MKSYHTVHKQLIDMLQELDNQLSNIGLESSASHASPKTTLQLPKSSKIHIKNVPNSCELCGETIHLEPVKVTCICHRCANQAGC